MLKKPRTWLGLLGTGVFLYFFLRALDFSDFARAIRGADYLYVLPSVAIYFFAVWFRAWRWQLLLQPVRLIPIVRLYPPLLIGYMVNNILPARVGDFFRSYLLGEKEKLSWSSALASVALERMFDTLNLILLAFAVSRFASVPTILSRTLLVLSIVLGIIILGSFVIVQSEMLTKKVMMALAKLTPARWKPKVATFVEDFVKGLDAIRKPQLLPSLIILSAAIWFVEAGMYYLLALSFDLDVTSNQLWLGILFAVAASNLLTAAPASSGGIGPFEFGAQRTLVHFGVAQATATAYAVVLHATLLIPVVVAGLFFLWVYHISFRDISRGAMTASAAPGQAEIGTAITKGDSEL